MILGCDVGKDFIILHGGKTWQRIEDKDNLPDLRGAIVILEQTGAYGLRWAEKLTNAGAEIYIADGKQFKRFRNAFDRRKDDYVDAYYLREFYLSGLHRKYIYAYNPQDKALRTYIRQWIRENKDLTRSLNRLRQYLAIIFPNTDHHQRTRYRLLKDIDKLIQELKESPHALSTVAIYEAQKVKLIASSLESLKQEIESIIKNHPDHPLLTTIPNTSNIMIATLIAYYWDINRFRDKKGFMGYTLIGATHEQSGKSINKKLTDKARTEVKGIFYVYFMQAYKETSPLKPLADYLKQTCRDYKKLFIKFTDYLLEIVYYMLKHRIDFKTALKHRIIEQNKQVESLKKKDLNKTQAYRLYRTIERLQVCKDIFTRMGEEPDLLPEAKINPRYSHSPKHSHSPDPSPDQARVCKELYKPDPDPFRSPMSRRKVENHTRQRPENNPRDKSPPTGG